MIFLKNIRIENGKNVADCEMPFEEYYFCFGLLAIENGKKLWEEVWENS